MSKNKKVSTIQCPICKGELELQPHPAKPEFEIAYCGCRGEKVAVIEIRIKPVAEVEEVESPNYKFFKEENK